MPHAPRPKFDPQKPFDKAQDRHHRRSIRLPGYDYSQEGAYYVTIVTQGRECMFGEIVDGEMRLNEYGEIVQKWWNEIPIHFPTVELGMFVIMPNHVHGIIFITTERRGEVISPHDNPNNNFQDAYVDETINLGAPTPAGRETLPLRKPTLGQIVAYFKYQSTKEMNRIETDKEITKFWQRNYGACPEPVEGNTLSVTKKICKPRPSTSTQTHHYGMKMMTILRTDRMIQVTIL
jgi:putative transposase